MLNKTWKQIMDNSIKICEIRTTEKNGEIGKHKLNGSIEYKIE